MKEKQKNLGGRPRGVRYSAIKQVRLDSSLMAVAEKDRGTLNMTFAEYIRHLISRRAKVVANK